MSTCDQLKEGVNIVKWLSDNFKVFDSIVRKKLELGQLSVKDARVQLVARILEGGIEKLEEVR